MAKHVDAERGVCVMMPQRAKFGANAVFRNVEEFAEADDFQNLNSSSLYKDIFVQSASLYFS